MSRRKHRGVPSGQPVRADRSHLRQSSTTSVSRAGWRQQPAEDNKPRLSADEILQQYLTSPVGSQRAQQLMAQYQAAIASGQLVQTTDSDPGDDD